MKKILTIIGTRPEAIKLFPIIIEMQKHSLFNNEVCITGQHTTLLYDLIDELGITAHYKLEIQSSTLADSAAFILKGLSEIFQKNRIDLVIVQGDTTSAFIGALAAFYFSIPVAHIEAGLRTGNLQSPWPEEAHRILIDKISSYFFAPTPLAYNNLITEGIDQNKIWLVGNTSIDAIRFIKESLHNISKQESILVTVHRRENYGTKLLHICTALTTISKLFPNIKIFFFLHPNPNIYNVVKSKLSGINNISLVSPAGYREFINYLSQSMLILTDSGGIQEEISYLGTPALILRDNTERPEVLEYGNAKLVGTKHDDIVFHCKELIENTNLRNLMSRKSLPFGDGYSAVRIVNILKSILDTSDD